MGDRQRYLEDTALLLLQLGVQVSAPQGSTGPLILAAMSGRRRLTDLTTAASFNGRFTMVDGRNMAEFVAETSQDPMDPMFIEELFMAALSAESLPHDLRVQLLGLCVKAGLVESTRQLLALGTSAHGQHLHRCVKELGMRPYRPYREIARLLLESGADPNRLADGLSPLDFALSSKIKQHSAEQAHCSADLVHLGAEFTPETFDMALGEWHREKRDMARSGASKSTLITLSLSLSLSLTLILIGGVRVLST